MKVFPLLSWLQLWNIIESEEGYSVCYICSLRGHLRTVNAVRFSPDGNLFDFLFVCCSFIETVWQHFRFILLKVLIRSMILCFSCICNKQERIWLLLVMVNSYFFSNPTPFCGELCSSFLLIYFFFFVQKMD